MPALEEKVLEFLARKAMTYDGLRSALRTTPNELDAALQNLDRTKDIKRAQGRILINNGLAPAPTIAQAVSVPEAATPKGDTKMAKKNCSKCTLDKERSEFGKNASKTDGLQAYCKTCMSGYDKKRATKKKPAIAAARASVAVKELTGVQQLAILETPGGGIRIGYLAKDGPLTTMPVSVDLSAAQLDELVAWRKARA